MLDDSTACSKPQNPPMKRMRSSRGQPSADLQNSAGVAHRCYLSRVPTCDVASIFSPRRSYNFSPRRSYNSKPCLLNVIPPCDVRVYILLGLEHRFGVRLPEAADGPAPRAPVRRGHAVPRYLRRRLLGRGFNEIRHSTDGESPPPPARVFMCNHPEGTRSTSTRTT